MGLNPFEFLFLKFRTYKIIQIQWSQRNNCTKKNWKRVGKEESTWVIQNNLEKIWIDNQHHPPFKTKNL